MILLQHKAVCLPDKAKGSHPHRLKIGIPGGDLEAGSRLAGSQLVPADGLRCPKYLGSNEFGHLDWTEVWYSMGRAREVSWFDGGFSDGLADESDILLSLIVWHPGSNQEDFAMPNDAGAPIMACSGNLVKLRRWCLSRSQRG